MSPDLEGVLHRTAQEPTRPLDVDGLLRRARRRRNRRRLAGPVIAALVVVGVLGAVPQLGSPSVLFDESPSGPATPAPVPSRPGTPTPTPPADSGSRGDVLLPAAPIEGRQGAVAVWTDEEVLVWGGWLDAEMGSHPDQIQNGEMYVDDDTDPIPIGEVRFVDGAAYDPATQRWRTIAPAPFPGGYQDQAVWTGREMLVWSAHQTQLVAYDPAGDDWRALPSPPEPAGDRPAATLLWTGSEAILWGGIDHQPELPAYGVAFDPFTDSWRELSPAPVPPRQWHSATWTGEEMIIWGGSDLVAHLGAELGGAAYDPVADTWRTLPTAPAGGRQDHTAVWTGSEILIWGGGLVEGLAYHPVEDRWRVLAAAPLRPHQRGLLEAVWTGEEMLAWGGRLGGDATDTAVYDPVADTWRELPDSPLSGRCRAATAWTGSGLFVWSGVPDCEIGMPPKDGAMLRAIAPPTPEKPEPEPADVLLDDCQILETGERRVLTSGVVGATLGPTLLDGIRPDLTVGPLVAVESDDPHFETPWYAISAVVSAPDRGALGTATWLSPNQLAVYAGGASPEDFETWSADPASDPDATHLYSANDLAAEVSVWRPTDETASAEAPSRDCAQQLTSE